MLQRVQSIYFLLAGVCQMIYAFSTLFTYKIEGVLQSQMVKGIVDANGVLLAKDNKNIILAIANAVLIWVVIFLYKKRVQQLKLSKVFLFVIFVQAFFVFLAYLNIQEYAKINDFSMSWTIFLLPTAFVLAFIGMRKVKKDEDLIKSVDRIR